MIYMQFGGGLGNQMFQYAFLYSQIKSYPLDEITIKSFMHRNNNEDRRDFALHHMQTSIHFDEVVDEDDLCPMDKLFLIRKKIIRKIIYKFTNKNDKKAIRLSKNGICSFPDIYFYAPHLHISDQNCYIEGAFQNWRYFDKYRNEILHEFTIKQCLNDANMKTLTIIQNCNAVCVHIRRGDFLNNFYAKELAICDYDYYSKAIELVRNREPNSVFFIFSNTHNDIEWIKQNYNFQANIIYVDLNNSDYEELHLMKACKHFILSNSTFSWWAQYLSNKEGGVVVAPSKWTKNENIDASGIYMPEWQLIEV